MFPGITETTDYVTMDRPFIDNMTVMESPFLVKQMQEILSKSKRTFSHTEILIPSPFLCGPCEWYIITNKGYGTYIGITMNSFRFGTRYILSSS